MTPCLLSWDTAEENHGQSLQSTNPEQELSSYTALFYTSLKQALGRLHLHGSGGTCTAVEAWTGMHIHDRSYHRVNTRVHSLSLAVLAGGALEGVGVARASGNWRVCKCRYLWTLQGWICRGSAMALWWKLLSLLWSSPWGLGMSSAMKSAESTAPARAVKVLRGKGTAVTPTLWLVLVATDFLPYSYSSLDVSAMPVSGQGETKVGPSHTLPQSWGSWEFSPWNRSLLHQGVPSGHWVGPA